MTPTMESEAMTIESTAALEATVQTNDKAVGNFKAKFTANYGAGTFDWKAILAMLMSLLGGCGIPLTPANIRAQVQRDTVQSRMLLRLFFMGVPASVRRRAVPAAVKTIHDGTDDELNSWVTAAQENE